MRKAHAHTEAEWHTRGDTARDLEVSRGRARQRDRWADRNLTHALIYASFEIYCFSYFGEHGCMKHIKKLLSL